ncbi:MAG: hypothetical protein ACI4AN_01255 [Muribaculaceae bacterium]
MDHTRNIFMATALIAILCAIGARAGEPAVEGYYADGVPEEAEVLRGYSMRGCVAKMSTMPLAAIEGVWSYPDEMMTVAIERFGSARFSPRIAYRVVMLEADDVSLLPGTVIGYVAESADSNKYELWLYSEQQGQRLRAPVQCVATLSDGNLLFRRIRSLNVKVRVNFARFLPKLFRGISVTPEVQTEKLPVGFRKIYPDADGENGSRGDEIRYL